MSGSKKDRSRSRRRTGGAANASDWREPGSRHYPRVARVNELLREVLAQELEELQLPTEDYGLLTITGVDCDPDLRHAKVLMASIPEAARAILSEERPRLQAAIARQVRMKRTPQLTFEVDPAVKHGQRVEQILRSIHNGDGSDGTLASPLAP